MLLDAFRLGRALRPRHGQNLAPITDRTDTHSLRASRTLSLLIRVADLLILFGIYELAPACLASLGPFAASRLSCEISGSFANSSFAFANKALAICPFKCAFRPSSV